MRLGHDGLAVRQSLGLAMPGVYHDDQNLQAITRALDHVLAPAWLTIDNLLAWFDPDLAPVDFLPYLASWVGVVLDEEWDPPRQRDAIAGAAELYRWRGTLGGLRREVALLTGAEPEIEESGAVAWSDRPGDALPGSPTPMLTVRVRVPDPGAVDRARLERIVRDAAPVSLPHTVEVIGDNGAAGAADSEEPT